MFKRKELAEIPNVKPIAAETKKQRAQRKKSSGQSSCADPQNNPK